MKHPSRIAKSAMVLVALGAVVVAAQTSGSLTPPRSPARQRITQMEQLLPNARLLVKRPYAWMAGGQYGLGLKAGEKLLIVSTDMDPLIAEAVAAAAREIGATADILAPGPSAVAGRRGRNEFDYERFDPTAYMKGSNAVARAMPDWLASAVDKYDVVLGYTARGTQYGKIGKGRSIRSSGLLWGSAEQFASPAVSYPEELLGAIAGSTWKILSTGKRFRLTDPMGTDITFTLDAANSERFKKTRALATYGRESLEGVLANETSVQVEPQLSTQPDARGVLVTQQVGLMPEIRIHFEGGRVVRIEGGGAPGENIRQALDAAKAVQYPGYYPGPGIGWLEELALGTHPKIGPAGPMRHRSGMIQLAFGTDRHNTVSDAPPALPPHHRDMDLFYYPTLEIDGKKLVDRGHLTTLDDPEVRRIAAKYGKPEELLREDWIPEFEKGSGKIVYPGY